MLGAQVPLHWPFIPSILLGLIVLTAAYFAAITRWRDRFPGSRPVSMARRLAFLGAMSAIFLALQSPIEVLSDGYLFSVHMVQHLLLTLLMPPLLLLGLPGWLIRPLFARLSPLLAITRAITNPLAGFALFNVIFIGYHVPAIYLTVQRSELLHVAGHLIFMAIGVITWWPVLSPLPEAPALTPPLQMIYLFAQTLPSQVLGALLTFTSQMLYPHYQHAPRVWAWLNPAADQQLGGLIMWVVGGTFFLGAFVVVFLRWSQSFEAAERQRRRATGRA